MRLFQHHLINGPNHDPALYVLLPEDGRAFLFDVGSLHQTRKKDLHRVDSVFVSHTHIDHFIGFDHLLRNLLGRKGTIRFYGPKGFVDQVHHRLRGYTWNLVDQTKLVIEVREVTGDRLEGKKFHLSEGFATGHPLEGRPHRGVLYEDKKYRVDFAVLWHKTDCLAFALVQKGYPRIDKPALHKSGLAPGPWLQEIIDYRKGDLAGGEIDVQGKIYTRSTLADQLLHWQSDQKLAYVVDTIYSAEVEAKVIELARDAEVFYCESAYHSKDRKKARENHHLCADESGTLAGKAGAKKYIPFHYSWSYNGRTGPLEEEALRAFRGKDGNDQS